MSVYLPLQAREGVRIMDADTGISARSDVTTSSCPSPSLVAASRSRTAAVLALMGLAPVMLVIAVAIKLSDKGAALFTQVRVAKGGEPFRIYKFRTMAVDAEARLAEIRQDNEFDGVLFKIRKDPRVTSVGARLRKWSLDELPQLFNVLRGEMSLVGSRLALPDEAAAHAAYVPRRLVVKPGISGMWQVNGRSDLSWGNGAPGPPLRRELVVRSRPANPVEDVLCDV